MAWNNGRALMAFTDLTSIEHQEEEDLETAFGELWVALDEREAVITATDRTINGAPVPTINHIEDFDATNAGITYLQSGDEHPSKKGCENLIIFGVDIGFPPHFFGRFARPSGSAYTNFDQVLTLAGYPGGWIEIEHQEDIRLALIQLQDVMAELDQYVTRNYSVHEGALKTAEGHDPPGPTEDEHGESQPAWDNMGSPQSGGTGGTILWRIGFLPGPLGEWPQGWPGQWRANETSKTTWTYTRPAALIGTAQGYDVVLRETIDTIVGNHTPTEDLVYTLDGNTETFSASAPPVTQFNSVAITIPDPGDSIVLDLEMGSRPATVPWDWGLGDFDNIGNYHVQYEDLDVNPQGGNMIRVEYLIKNFGAVATFG